MDNRGQTNVLGIVLLLGITVIGVTSVVVIGSDALTATGEQVRIGNAQHQFQRVDSIISRVAYEGGDIATLDLSSLQLGENTELRYEQTGYLTVSNEDAVLLNRSLGILIYKSGDQQIAYQAGGVWAGTGNRTQLISRPEFQYRGTTLTLPMISLKGTDVYQSESLTVRQTGHTNRVSNSYVEDSLVIITIQSRYYRAWGSYFDQQFTDIRLQYDHSNDSVTIELGEIQQGTAELNNAIFGSQDKILIKEKATVNGDVTTTGFIDLKEDATVTGNITEETTKNVSPIDSQIQELVNASDTISNHTTIDEDGTTPLTSGTYFVNESVTLKENSGEIVLDVGSGDVTLIFDEDVTFKEKTTVRVKNPGGGIARIYLTEDLLVKEKADVSVPGDDATSLRIYATSESTLLLKEESTFVGTFYAPRNPPDTPSEALDPGCGIVSICVKEKAKVHGALVGGNVVVKEEAEVTYDSDLRDVKVPFSNPPEFERPHLTHLHVSARNVTMTG